jgi:predicted unusual protein kinase regulating ubiquinone biosynthesis (AarF/ABC1/UbiB family)
MFKFVAFLAQTFWIISREFVYYLIFKNYQAFVHNIVKDLSTKNVLYIKIFQAISLNHFFIDEEINNELLKFTDHSPFDSSDINFNLLQNIIHENNLTGDIYNPINSGMISLVYKMKNNIDNKDVILKVKRNNINERLQDSMDNVLWFFKLLSFLPFPILNTFEIHKTIQKNIDVIHEQLDFTKEVKNMKRMKNNCTHMNYVIIPDVYEEVTNKYSDVIMMEYIAGDSITNVDPEDYDIYSKLITKFGFACILNHGFSHGDFHAGNILFIKETQDENPIYKLGILDFGIMTEIDKDFKQNCISLFMNLFDDSPRSSGIRLFYLMIEPKDVIKTLQNEDYESVISIFEKYIDIFILNGKIVTQNRLYELMCDLNSYLKKNNLAKYGLYLNDNFVKMQVALSMSQGVTLHLSKDRYLNVANEALKEMFHFDIFSESGN